MVKSTVIISPMAEAVKLETTSAAFCVNGLFKIFIEPVIFLSLTIAEYRGEDGSNTWFTKPGYRVRIAFTP